MSRTYVDEVSGAEPRAVELASAGVPLRGDSLVVDDVVAQVTEVAEQGNFDVAGFVSERAGEAMSVVFVPLGVEGHDPLLRQSRVHGSVRREIRHKG